MSLNRLNQLDGWSQLSVLESQQCIAHTLELLDLDIQLELNGEQELEFEAIQLW